MNFEKENKMSATTEHGDWFSGQSKDKKAYPDQANKKLVYVGKIFYIDGIYCTNDVDYYFWQW